MAQKKITDLQLISAVTDSLSVPSDNTIQSYRFTALQMWNYIQTKLIGATGDIPYATSSTASGKLAIGTGAQQAIRPVAGVPAWSWPHAVQTTQTTTYAISATADHVVLLNANGAAFTATLPTAASVAGKTYILKKIDTTLNVVTIATTSSQTIDGVVGTTLNTSNETLTIISDGSNWQIVSRRIPSVWTTYTPTFVGLGTVTGIAFKWRRNGSALEVKGVWINGTVTGSTVTISFPTGLTCANTSLEPIGFGYRATNTAAQVKALVVLSPASGGTGMNLSLEDTAAALSPTSAQTGTVGFATGAGYFISHSSFEITGWNG